MELWNLCKITQRKQMVASGCSSNILSSFEHHGFPGGSEGKESICNAGDPALIPGSGRSPGEGNCYPLQYSCLESPMDRGGWWATVQEVAKIWTWLSDQHFHFFKYSSNNTSRTNLSANFTFFFFLINISFHTLPYSCPTQSDPLCNGLMQIYPLTIPWVWIVAYYK